MNKAFLLLFSAFLIVSCHSKSSSTATTTTTTDGSEATSNATESAMSEANSHASSSEGSSTPGAGFAKSSISSILDPQELAATSACSYSSNRSTCSSGTDTIAWASCTVAKGTLTGGWTETWDTCPTTAGVVTTGHSVTRTSSLQTLTFNSGAYVTTDTSAHTAYDGTAIPGTGVTISNTSGTRTITINGIHKTEYGPYGKKWFDHSITGTLSVTGKRSTSNRIITGTQTLYHNLAKYKAAHTYNSVTWSDSTCCYPTGGSITSVFSGSKTGNATLAFSSTCGEATYTDTDASSSTITLTHCQ